MKKHKFLSIFAIMFALVFALSICFFAACGNKEDNDDDTTVTIPDDETKNEDTTEDESEGSNSDTVTVLSVTIDSTLDLTLGTKETGDLTAAVVMSDGNDYTGSYTWESSDTDEKVISVTSKGNTATVTAVDIGEATITVTVGNDTTGTKTADCKVTVKEILPDVKVDFSEPETYSWIETVQETAVVDDGEGGTTENPHTDYQNYYDVVPLGEDDYAYTNGILSLAPTYDGMVIRTDQNGLATGGEASDAGMGNYFVVDLSDYEGYYVSVDITMSNTGSSNGYRSLFLATDVVADGNEGEVLAYVSSNANSTGKQELIYEMEIEDIGECPALYLTWDNSIYIRTMEISISRSSDYVEAPTRIDVYSEDEAVESLALVIPTGYNYEEITTGQSELALVTAALEADAVNEHNLKFVYEGGYTWKSSNEAVVVVDETGVITAVSEGTAIVTVCLEGNPDVYTTLEVEVNHPAYVERIEYTWTYGMGMVYDESPLTVRVVMSDGSTYEGGYSWSVSGNSEAISISEDATGSTVDVGWTGYGVGVLTLTLDGDYGSYSITFSADDDTMVCTIEYDDIFETAQNG